MYETLAKIAQQGGTLLFVFAFILVLIYALAPSNRQKFDRAARQVLDDDDEQESEKI